MGLGVTRCKAGALLSRQPGMICLTRACPHSCKRTNGARPSRRGFAKRRNNGERGRNRAPARLYPGSEEHTQMSKVVQARELGVIEETSQAKVVVSVRLYEDGRLLSVRMRTFPLITPIYDLCEMLRDEYGAEE